MRVLIMCCYFVRVRIPHFVGSPLMALFCRSNCFLFFIFLFFVKYFFIVGPYQSKHIFCSFSCVFATRAYLHQLENNRKKLVKWRTGNNSKSYLSLLRILNILPLSVSLQSNDILLWSRITHEEMGSGIGLPERFERKVTRLNFLKFERHEQSMQEVGSSENADWSIDWTNILTPWTLKDWKTEFYIWFY